ncbi:MAG: 4-coumarate--CoA ligase family protein [Hyphomicrobiales bacterium]|nr:4-coumarate--CoA ligase family protein [Hyphomicrobiales bacterium]
MAIVNSKITDLEIRDISVTEFVFEGLSKDPDWVVIIDGPTGRKVTAAALMDDIRKLAGGLIERNFDVGKTIALMSPNVPEYFTVFHGVAWAGGTITTINPSYTANEISHQLRDSSAQMLVVHNEFIEKAKEAIIDTGVKQIVTIGKIDGITSLDELMGKPLKNQVTVDLDNHVVALPYSSGTTGLPKGVMLTHRNIVANLCQVNAVGTLDKSEDNTNTTPAFAPFFHIYGLLYFVNVYPASLGTIITMPRFDLEMFLQLARDHKSINLWVVPPVALLLANHPLVEDYDLSAVELIFCAAAPLSFELSDAVSTRLDCTVVQGYGMTELSPVCHLVPKTAPRSGSVGQTIAGTSCRIIDIETGEDVDTGEKGEIWVKGPQVMKGYLNNPAATAQMIDNNGWLKTGDVGYFDRDEYLFVVDRVKELIKYKAFQVAPAELEGVLVEHPDIVDAAVIGIPDDAAGEIPMAFVIAKEGSKVTLESVQTYVSQNLASYKQVRRLELVDSIPKSPAGKILRRLLRDQVRN